MIKKNKGTIFFVCLLSLAAFLITRNIIHKERSAQEHSANLIEGKKEVLSKIDDRSTESTDKLIRLEQDPSQKTPDELILDRKIEAYLMKQFYIIREDASGDKKSKQFQSKISWIANYISNNEIWYKSDYHDDLSDSKITIFFNYYNCKKINPKTKEHLKCFTVNLYNFRNENWFAISRASYEEAILWRNNTAYVQLYLEYLGDFTRHTNAWMIMVPMPRDSMPIYYIRHENNKTILNKGPDSDWVLTNEKEFEKFQKWTEGYKVKHGETPDR